MFQIQFVCGLVFVYLLFCCCCVCLCGGSDTDVFSVLVAQAVSIVSALPQQFVCFSDTGNHVLHLGRA